MASPLVATKLYVPRLRDGLVARRRLTTRLQDGAEVRLTLISAPAGFGKSTLLAEWLAATASVDRRVAWLSLDDTDNDPSAFWSHLIAALQTASPGVGAAALALLQTGQPADESVLAVLLNELAGLPQSVHLVLDDYHAIDQPSVQAGMTFFVEHLPPNVHLVISTRADPPLPLPRLRARGELVEIRSADLRFTSEETSSYLSSGGDGGLTEQDIAVLGERTEGWIAALQLAALSMAGRSDLSSFISSFQGSDRYIVDYLVEEVLQRQPDDIRHFLLHTCFLTRLSAPLCEAVTGSGNAGAMLQALDRANLFLVPLDARRQWYRYHHLFADVLQTHFSVELADLLPTLQRRASAWYAGHGDRPEAIRHALAGGDFESAAGLIELELPQMQRNRGEATIRRWAHILPVELVSQRPVLGIGLVGGLMSFGEFDGIEQRLGDVEHSLVTLGGVGDASTVVVDRSQLPRVPGAIELYRAALAQVRGDVPGIIEHAQRVLELAPADDHLGRAAGSSMLGIALWSGGKLEPACRAWIEGRSGLQRAGHIADMLGVSLAIADISFAQGQLRTAVQTCEQALTLSANPAGPVLRGTADMHAELAELHRERNDFAAARRHLLTSQELGEQAGLPQHPYRWRVAAAHLQRDEGHLDAADALLEQAGQVYVSDFFPLVRPIVAMRARLWIAQGRLDDASRWARDSGIGVDDDLTYLREYEHVTLAWLLLARLGQGDGGNHRLLAFLDRLLDAAVLGGRNGSVIEILCLQALARRSADIEAALAHLERALGLAVPEGYVRLFVTAGQPMATLLKLASKRRSAPALARQVLAAFGADEPTPMPAYPDLIEPLSERELDVLRLLRSDLGGPDIARELGISENTMRTHTRNIYDKLGVSSRRSAVSRAEELDLPTRTGKR